MRGDSMRKNRGKGECIEGTLCWEVAAGWHCFPKFLKIGAWVRYRPEDVEEWLDSRPAGGECPESASRPA